MRGAQGTKEKDLALAVARRVKGIIEGRLGIRVLLTRDDDRNIPLDDRTALANNNKADLFISLHANASVRRSAAGATVFLAAFDDSDSEAARPAPGERLPTFGGGLRDIELVPWNLAQTRHLTQSIEFATILEQQLRNRVPLSAHPIDRAPLAHPRIGQHAGGAARNGIPVERGTGKTADGRCLPGRRGAVDL